MPGSWMRQWTLVSSTSISASTAWPMAWTVRFKPVARPIGVDMARAARDMVRELVDVVGDPPVRLVAAELVRKVDVDWSLHGCKDAAMRRCFSIACGF